jgi:hypothetical protein
VDPSREITTMSEAENPTTLDTAADRLRRLEAAWNDPEKSRRSLKWLAGDLGIPESTLRRMTRGRRIGLGDPSSRVVGRNGRSFPARIAPPAPPPPSAAPAADPPPPTAAVTVPDPFMPFPPPPHPWDVAPVPNHRGRDRSGTGRIRRRRPTIPPRRS